MNPGTFSGKISGGFLKEIVWTTVLRMPADIREFLFLEEILVES